MVVVQWVSPVVQTVKNLPAMQETQVRFLGGEDALEKGMATHTSILAWRIPWTEKTGGLYSPWGRKELDTTEWLTLFTAGPMVEYPPANARGHRFDPWSRKIAHAEEQLSWCATTTEPVSHSYWSVRAYSLCSTIREARIIRSPCTTTSE